jgi:hypothetical protein
MIAPLREDIPNAQDIDEDALRCVILVFLARITRVIPVVDNRNPPHPF